MNKPKELKLEDLKNWEHYLTVGRLRKFLNESGLPDDAKVLVQRVEDSYYEGSDISGMRGCQETEDGIYPPGSKASGWPVVLKKGEFYHDRLVFNENMREEIERRAKGEKPKYSMENPEDYIASEEELDSMKEQYSPAWCYVRYNDDKNNLYLDLHY